MHFRTLALVIRDLEYAVALVSIKLKSKPEALSYPVFCYICFTTNSYNMAKVSIYFKGLTCIYAVLAPTGKIYVGQTWDLYHRYKSGVSKNQRLLYRSYQKHGEDNHKLFTIIEFKGAFTQSDLDYWERYYIEVYRNEGYKLLNIREGGGNKGKLSEETKALVGFRSREWKKENPEKVKEIALRAAKANIGKKRSEETKRLQREAAKGRLRSEDHCRNLSLAKRGKSSTFKGKSFSAESKLKLSNSLKGKGAVAICQYQLDGTFVKEWPSIKQAAETLSLPTGTIGGCVRKVKHYKTCGGFIWRYKSDSLPIIPTEHVQTYNPKECAVVQIDPSGIEIAEYNSVKEAAEKTGTSRTNLIKCCRGQRNKAGGFIWKYNNPYL